MIKIKNKIKKEAYSLVEISIVILIVALLVSGSFSAIKVGMKNSEEKITKQNIAKSYEAIGKFLQTNKRLPCPASIKYTPESDNDFGIELRTTSSGILCGGNGIYNSGNLVYGMIPVKSIGISDSYASDGYGNKIAYVVDNRLTGDLPTAPFSNYITTNSFGTVNLNSQSDYGMVLREKPQSVEYFTPNIKENPMKEPIIGYAIAIISYGQNMMGSFGFSSSVQLNRSNDPSERDNDINQNPPYFDSIFTVYDGESKVFDDVVFLKTKNELVSEFEMKDIIACNGSELDTAKFGIGGSNPQSVYYGTEVQSSTTCPSPYSSERESFKCGLNGQWQQTSICPSVSDCVFPADDKDGVLKSRVVISGSNNPGYSRYNSSDGTTDYVWDCIRGGTVLLNGNTFSSSSNFCNADTPASPKFSAGCINGIVSIIWNP